MTIEEKIESVRDQMAIMSSMPEKIAPEPAEICAELHTEIENLAIRFIEVFESRNKEVRVCPTTRYAAHLSMILKHLCLTGYDGAEKITERYENGK